jgi:hypothetical protein
MTYSPTNFGRSVPAGTTSRFPTNGTVSTILKLSPVRTSSNGIDLIDVSNEAQANAVIGVLPDDIAPSASGEVVGSGTITNITTSAAVGDVMYIAKDGTLTNTKPSIGVNSFVADDWIVRMGVVAKNASNPVQKDLIVNVNVVGKL